VQKKILQNWDKGWASNYWEGGHFPR